MPKSEKVKDKAKEAGKLSRKTKEKAIVDRMLRGNWTFNELMDEFSVSRPYLKKLLKRLKEKLTQKSEGIPPEKFRVLIDRLTPLDDLDALIEQVIRNVDQYIQEDSERGNSTGEKPGLQEEETVVF
ncbi:MAG: hypothetical protein QW835_00700 [Candidatus Hadarchaeum sp.]